MKLLCETKVIDRNTQAVKSVRCNKATLALGYKLTAGNDKVLEMVHFTLNNKCGTKYKLIGNIESVHTRYFNEGKTTICFRVPPEDLFIKAEHLPLKSFLRSLKLGLDGAEMNLRNIAGLTAIPKKKQPVERIVITKRSKFPTSFPKGVKWLTVTGIGLERVPRSICILEFLTEVDLSRNRLRKIPKAFGNLPLKSVNLSNNNVGEEPNWDWMTGKTIRSTLLDLDLSVNHIDSFPYNLVKLDVLVALRMNENSMESLPFSIRRLQNLRYLYLNSNKLRSLPACIEQMRLQSLDIASNNFSPRIQAVVDLPTGAPSLWILAGRAIIKNKVIFDKPGTLPMILVDLLKELPICYCGKIVYDATIYKSSGVAYLRAISFLLSNASRIYLTDNVICSRRCYGFTILNRPN